MKRKRSKIYDFFLASVGVVFVVIILVGFVMVIASRRGPYDYRLDRDTPPIKAREAMIAQVETELAAAEEDYRLNGDDAESVRADKWYPLDRTRIVLSIERYIIDQGAPPDSMEVLYDTGHLPVDSLYASGFSVESEGDVWRVHWRAVRGDRPIAIGD